MLKVIYGLEKVILVVLLTAMALVTFVQVVARYVFNSGVVWALELTVFLFAWLVLLGAVQLAREGRHIGIDALISVLRPGPKKIAGLIASAACVAYGLMMFSGAWTYFYKMYRIGIPTADLRIPTWWVMIVLPVAFGFLSLRFGISFLKILTGRADSMLSSIEDQELVEELDAAQASHLDTSDEDARPDHARKDR